MGAVVPARHSLEHPLHALVVGQVAAREHGERAERQALPGSANWDARSLRLNFELNVEGYGRAFAAEMGRIIERKLRGAREVTLAEVDARIWPAKLRDAVARLFSPYL